MDRESDMIQDDTVSLPPEFVEVVEEFSPVVMFFSMAGYHRIRAEALIPCDFRDCWGEKQ